MLTASQEQYEEMYGSLDAEKIAKGTQICSSCSCHCHCSCSIVTEDGEMEW